MILVLKKHDPLTIESSPKPEKDNENNQWEKDNIRVMELLVDGVKNNLLPFIAKLESAYNMTKALKDMFEINNTSRHLTLKNQLAIMKMNKVETITSYLMRITDLRNQLLTIGHIYDSKELTMVTLNGLPTLWENFRQGVCASSKLPKFD